MSNEFSGTQGTKESISCQGYRHGHSPGDFEHEPAIMKRKKDNLEEKEFYGNYQSKFSTVEVFFYLT